MWRAVAILVLAACGSDTPPAVRGTLAITNVRVFDGERVRAGADVLVDGATIVAVGTRLTLPAGIATIDGTGKTLLPGLLDAHAHVFEQAQLEQALAFGVTTVLDMFAMPSDITKLRAADAPDRADLRSAGIVATAPGGHGTEYGFAIPTITAPSDAQAFVDARLAEGSDYLKIVYDSGDAYGIAIPTLDVPTLGALIDAAHARTRLAVVHVGTYAEARTAIERGADGLVHTFQDVEPARDFGALVASKRAFVTPTLVILRAIANKRTLLGWDPAVVPYLPPAARDGLDEKFRLTGTVSPTAIGATISQLRAAGATILVGSDAPNPGTAHGASVHEELALLVAAGLTPQEALAGATSLTAGRFGLADRGRIVAGTRADLVLVDGDPTTTITDSRRIVGIWRAGVRFDREAYRVRNAR